MAKKPTPEAPAQTAPPKAPVPREVFIAALENGQTIGAAAALAGVGRRTVYDWRKADPAVFGAAWDEAVALGTDVLEDEALKRALNGSDTMLIFMLKARRPNTYRDRVSQEISGPDGKAIAVNTGFTLVLNVSPSDSGD